MIDIALIREKPEWVKQQILKLNDPGAAARVDAIVELDKQRRALLTESESIQAARNKLNKAMGRLRGDKNLDAARPRDSRYRGSAADRSGRITTKRLKILSGQRAAIAGRRLSSAEDQRWRA